MGDSSLRIVGSVLGLRRFTLPELVHNAKVEPSAARSWLRRNKCSFTAPETASTGGMGRPLRVWRLTAEAEARYAKRLAKIASTRLNAAVHGSDRPVVTQLAALDEAEGYLVLARGTKSPDERNTALAWASEWADAAARRVVSHKEVGDVVASEVLHKLLRVQVDVSALRHEEVHRLEQAEVDLARLPTTVLAIARNRVACLEAWSFTEVCVPREPDRLAASGPAGLEAVGSLAALGLLTSFKTTVGACRAWANQVRALSPTTFMKGLGLLDRSLARTWSTDAGTMFVAICAGIEQHPELFGDPRVSEWLDGSFVRAADQPAVKGAYLRIRLHTPGAHRTEVLDLAGVAAPTDAWPITEVCDHVPALACDFEPESWATAERSLMAQGLAYYRATSESHRVLVSGRSESARFRSAFMQEDLD
ncbi:hypothetical protein ACFZ8E_03970 [Methylobacterium sp. HMF5984]|uniref:hypothetical protein n=1 Tax=Methylobacterium sp. HMF5984 TaxID=3367370 RepID=UPI0038525347